MKNQQIFQERRERFFTQLGGSAAIIPASTSVTHHADCEYPFRQNSDFWYLTGFDEPDAVALFLPHRPKGDRYILFVRPKESSLEIWNGFRWGVNGVCDHFAVDDAYPIEELPNRLSEYLEGSESITFRIGKHPRLEPLVLKVWAELIDKQGLWHLDPKKIFLTLTESLFHTIQVLLFDGLIHGL